MYLYMFELIHTLVHFLKRRYIKFVLTTLRLTRVITSISGRSLTYRTYKQSQRVRVGLDELKMASQAEDSLTPVLNSMS